MHNSSKCCLLLLFAIGFYNAKGAGQKDSAEKWRKVEASPGNVLFKHNCAQCHENPASGAPPRAVLANGQTAKTIYNALTKGRMKLQAAHLSDLERRQIAEAIPFPPGRLSETQSRPPLLCKDNTRWFDFRDPPVGNGWGIDEANTRLIPEKQAGLAAKDLKSLRLQWSFAFPDVTRAAAQPLIAGGGLFVGSQDGTVYALDARNGCVHWTYAASAEVAGSPVLSTEGTGGDNPAEDRVLFFGDRFAYVHAVDAATGALRWKAKVDEHPAATVVGTPALLNGRLYVPVVSVEEGSVNAGYSCCTFRGSIVALNTATGARVWKRYTIPSPAVEQHKNALGKPQFGPSGAGVWSSPTIDRRRGLLYFATGNGYSEPGDENSDAVFAIDLETSEVKWRTQTIAGDNWNTWDFFCRKIPGRLSEPGCPNLRKPGDDIDLTTSPILIHAKNSQDVVVVGRKDGTTFAMEADTGKRIWATRTTQNPDPYIAALYFGIMAEGAKVFVPSLGTTVPNPAAFISAPEDGLYALNAYTGERLWAAPVSRDCAGKKTCLGIAFAPIGFPGAVFVGTMDGDVRAYDSGTGKVLWHFNTAREFVTLNGDIAKGGGIARSGIMIANGMLYVNSGYNGMPGNVLLAFSVDQRKSTR